MIEVLDMENSIISKGKNITEAVHIALELLDVTKKEVNIEVMETEKKGILGIGSKPAVVRVTLRNVKTETSKTKNRELSLEQFVENMDNVNEGEGFNVNNNNLDPAIAKYDKELRGKVWIRDGQFFCKNALDQYPMLSPVKGIRLYKNEELVEKTVVVNEDDVFRIEIPDEKTETVWDIKIDEQRMRVTLTIKPGYHTYRKLIDQEPSKHIQLKLEEVKKPQTIETNAILEKLKELEVVEGINYLEITSACEAKEPGVFLIAEGKQPLPGQYGAFIPGIELNTKSGPKESADGKVNYREIHDFPSIVQGGVIGVIQPPIQGKPGLKVTGESVEPPEVFSLKVHAGKGTVLVDNESKVIATEAGQPCIKLKGMVARISIVPKLTHPGDVNLSSGNIHFIGDIEVMGSVQDGMLVEGEGNILIHGNANMSKIIAGNSVIVNCNLISSNLTAGKGNIQIAELSPILEEMAEETKRLGAAVMQITKISAFKVTDLHKRGLGSLFKILLDGKFKKLHSLIHSFLGKMNGDKNIFDEEWLDLANILKKNFVYLQSSEFKSVEDVMNFSRKMEKLYFETLTPSESNCFIKFDYAHNSQVYCNGDIVAIGQGCYNSKIYAVGSFETDGFFRGGELYAGKGVKLKEAGTIGGINTIIAAPHDQTIQIDQVMEDTTIQIGKKKHKFAANKSFILARLDHEGNLIIH
jgi:predicted RNA-binding protein Jag